MVFLLLSAAAPLAALRAAQPTAYQITNFTASPTGVTIQWSSAGADQVYTLQARDAFPDGLWLSLTDQRPWPIPVTEWIGSPGGASATRFYRVIAAPRAERGRLLSAVKVEALTTNYIATLFLIAQVSVVPQYAVEVHKIVYETIDPWGGRTQASGAVAVPLGLSAPLPLVSYQHGTLVATNEAPSVAALERLPGVGFATVGYVVALPDLLGLGESPGLHPYHHAQSEATACVDMLRAVRAWCASSNVALNDRLFLCGYSQGGHVTAALQRELEAYHTNEFAIAASALMAGAYDLSGVTANQILSGAYMPNPYYLPYLLAAYQSVYRLTNSLADLLASPYDTTLPPLFNGVATGGQINAAMPADRTQARLILKPEVLAAFETQPQHPLRVALRDNDLYAWTPRAPTRLYHCRGDEDVSYANSEVALASFQSRGATQVELIDPNPAADHGGCVIPSFLLARAWFDSLR
jgi:hypothetical protein